MIVKRFWYIEETPYSWKLYWTYVKDDGTPLADPQRPHMIVRAPKYSSSHVEYWPAPSVSEFIADALNAYESVQESTTTPRIIIDEAFEEAIAVSTEEGSVRDVASRLLQKLVASGWSVVRTEKLQSLEELLPAEERV